VPSYDGSATPDENPLTRPIAHHDGRLVLQRRYNSKRSRVLQPYSLLSPRQTQKKLLAAFCQGSAWDVCVLLLLRRRRVTLLFCVHAGVLRVQDRRRSVQQPARCCNTSRRLPLLRRVSAACVAAAVVGALAPPPP
jgi:hypothetical protein